MELDTEKFIETACTEDRSVLASFLDNEVFHHTFGNGKIIGAEVRDTEEGPIFRVQFDEKVKEFNLDSFREGYIHKGTVSNLDQGVEESSVNPATEVRAVAEAC